VHEYKAMYQKCRYVLYILYVRHLKSFRSSICVASTKKLPAYFGSFTNHECPPPALVTFSSEAVILVYLLDEGVGILVLRRRPFQDVGRR
jgi:hypothetical protein